MESFDRTRRRPGESGQTAVVVLIVLSVFLLGVLGFATDYAQVWAHRQSAQAAADAACQAGAADLFLNYANSGSGLDFSWIGTAFTCTSSSTNSVCKYASYNGYSGSSVSATFPSSVSGVSLTGFGTFPYPFIKVTVTDSVPMTFSRLFQSSSTFSVTASATCGASPVSVPIPMVVLNKTASGSFALSGNPTITIIGGPNRSIQVDSDSTTAFTAGGSSLVDLSLAGESGTGADVGVFGNETQISTKNLKLGTGKWVSPSLPYGDPWATITLPSKPSTAGSVTSVGYGANGCPDPKGCTEFSAGDYTNCTNSNGNLSSGGKGCLVIPTKYNISFNTWQPTKAYTTGSAVRPTSGNAGTFVFQATTSGTSGGSAPVWPQSTGSTVTDGTITWKNMGNPGNSPQTAIFDPGLYYLDSTGLQLNSNSTVRPSTATGDGSYGTTFYFSAGGTDISVASNSGSSAACTSVSNPTASGPSGSPSNCVTSYTVDGTSYLGILSQALECPSGASNPTQLSARLDGNILLGPCSGTYTAVSTDGKSYRGFLFMQTRSTTGTASWGGGGQFLLAGFMYFHDTSYASSFTLSGNSGAGAYTLGNIVSDNLTLGGSSGIDMVLNPATSYSILRPTLLQ